LQENLRNLPVTKSRTVRISDSQREQLQFSNDELEDLLGLVERIFDQNNQEGISSGGLQAIGQLSESILETQKHLKAFRRTQ
jgi:hypothetical protein